MTFCKVGRLNGPSPLYLHLCLAADLGDKSEGMSPLREGDRPLGCLRSDVHQSKVQWCHLEWSLKCHHLGRMQSDRTHCIQVCTRKHNLKVYVLLLFTFITIDNNQTDRLHTYPGFSQGCSKTDLTIST